MDNHWRMWNIRTSTRYSYYDKCTPQDALPSSSFLFYTSFHPPHPSASKWREESLADPGAMLWPNPMPPANRRDCSRKRKIGRKRKKSFLSKRRWVYWNPTPFVQVLIWATGKLKPCGQGAILMWDRIDQMSNSQMTNSLLYRTILRIPTRNISMTESLLLQIFPNRKQPPDVSRLLLETHRTRPYAKHPRNAFRPPSHHCCRWIISCECRHLVLVVPSKPMILAKGPWWLGPSIQALGVPSRNVLGLILIPNLSRPTKLNDDRSWEVLTSSRLHGLQNFQNEIP